MKNKYINYHDSKDLKKMGIKDVGNEVYIEKTCRIIGIKNISIGNNVRIDSFCNLIVHKGYLELKSNIHIGSSCHIVATGGVKMENFSGLSEGVKIFSASDDFSGKYMTNPTVNKKFTKVKFDNIIINKHVIIGANSVILPGVKIGVGSAVGALSIVNKSLAKWGIYSGIPAKKIRSRSKNLLILEKKYKKYLSRK